MKAKIDKMKLAVLWRKGVSAKDIAEQFSCNPPAVNRAAIKMGLPSRRVRRPSLSTGTPHKPKPRPVPAPKPSGAKIRAVKADLQETEAEAHLLGELRAAGGRWTPGRDDALAQTNGKYSKINRLAEKWGIPVRAALARFHIVRPK